MCFEVWDLRDLGVQGLGASGLGLWGSGFLGFKVWGLGFQGLWVKALGFRVLKLKVLGFWGFRFLGFEVLGLEFLSAGADVFGSNFGGLGSRASISDTYFTLYKQNNHVPNIESF